MIGAIGPGTKLPSLGHIAYRELEAGLRHPGRGADRRRRGRAADRDLPGPLQIKAAVNGCRHAIVRRGRELPLMVQVTIETTGTMLVGTDILAAIAIIDALGVPVIGLNCATGPKEMAEHVRQLSQTWRGLISCLPNAGLPELRCGHTHYPSHRTSWPAGSSASLPRMASISSAAAAAPRPSTSPRSTPCCGGMAEDGFRPRPSPGSAAHALAGLPVLGRAAAPGERVPRHRRALQCQRLEAVPRAAGRRRLGRLRRHGSRAGARGQQRARRLHGLRRPRRGGRDDRRRRAPARPGRQPAGDRSTELPVLEAALASMAARPCSTRSTSRTARRRPPPA